MYGGVWEKLFPGIETRVLGASPMFWVPGSREICLWMSAVDAAKKVAVKIIEKFGLHLMVYPVSRRSAMAARTAQQLALLSLSLSLSSLLFSSPRLIRRPTAGYSSCCRESTPWQQFLYSCKNQIQTHFFFFTLRSRSLSLALFLLLQASVRWTFNCSLTHFFPLHPLSVCLSVCFCAGWQRRDLRD